MSGMSLSDDDWVTTNRFLDAAEKFVRGDSGEAIRQFQKAYNADPFSGAAVSIGFLMGIVGVVAASDETDELEAIQSLRKDAAT